MFIDDIKMFVLIRSSEFEIQFDCKYSVDEGNIEETEISDVKIYSEKKKKFIKPSLRLQKAIIHIVNTEYGNELDNEIKETWGV
jgi:hypothetical protein